MSARVNTGGSLWSSRCEPTHKEVAATSSPAPREHPAETFGGLLQTIESEVIPRLLMLHRRDPQQSISITPRPTRDDVEELGRLVLSHHERVAFSFVEALLQEGMPLDRLYLDLLAPTARHLGELWKADLCSFSEVTLGLYRLQQLVHELGPRYSPPDDRSDPGNGVLLAALPGEQHTFGLLLLEDAFVRNGWEVALEHPESMAALATAVRERPYDVVGISSACDDQVDLVALAVRIVRKAAGSRPLGVLVGGRAFTEDHRLALRVGADGTASEAQGAVAQATRLLYLLRKVDTLSQI